MCIAIGSPMGVTPPSIETLKKCWDNNPDGAGIAYNFKGQVNIIKGFMTWDAFKAAWENLNKRFDLTKRSILIHFRIATHGGVHPECCHPFPIVADEGTIKKLEYTSDYAVIHNGRISLTSSDTYSRTNMSDTMVFIEKYLSKLASNHNWFMNKVNMELIHDMIDSKMAILAGNGLIRFTAGFEKGEDGNFYSNTTYKEDRKKTTTYVNYGSSYYGRYSDYDYEDYSYASTTLQSIYGTRLQPGDVITFEDKKCNNLIVSMDTPVFMDYTRQNFYSTIISAEAFDNRHSDKDKVGYLISCLNDKIYKYDFPKVKTVTRAGANVAIRSDYRFYKDNLVEMPVGVKSRIDELLGKETEIVTASLITTTTEKGD